MKKSIIAVAAVAIIAEIYAKNPKMEIVSPSLHLPNNHFGTIEKNITISWNRVNPYYENSDDFSSVKIFDIFSANICNNGDCFTGIKTIRHEKTSCNIYGNCYETNVTDFWLTKGEDDFWMNFEIGF